MKPLDDLRHVRRILDVGRGSEPWAKDCVERIDRAIRNLESMHDATLKLTTSGSLLCELAGSDECECADGSICVRCRADSDLRAFFLAARGGQ